MGRKRRTLIESSPNLGSRGEIILIFVKKYYYHTHGLTGRPFRRPLLKEKQQIIDCRWNLTLVMEDFLIKDLSENKINKQNYTDEILLLFNGFCEIDYKKDISYNISKLIFFFFFFFYKFATIFTYIYYKF
jgi:hypothetical protein